MGMKRIKLYLSTIIATSILTTTMSCTTEEIISRLSGAAVSAGQAIVQSFFITPEKEKELGDSWFNQHIQEQYPLYEANQELVDYVRELGNKLAKFSERKDEINFQFYVVESQEINAFAYPGGRIIVTTELLKYLKNEAELVAILGHEIGHIDKKHSLARIRTDMIAAGVLNEVVKEDDNEFLKQASQISSDLILKNFGRDEEKESDVVGVRLAAKYDYDLDSLTGFHKTMLDLFGEVDFFSAISSSHPPSKERIENVEKFIKDEKITVSKSVKNKDVYVQKTSVLPPRVVIQ